MAITSNELHAANLVAEQIRRASVHQGETARLLHAPPQFTTLENGTVIGAGGKVVFTPPKRES
jgi:hypothetical protein